MLIKLKLIMMLVFVGSQPVNTPSNLVIELHPAVNLSEPLPVLMQKYEYKHQIDTTYTDFFDIIQEK